MFEDAPMTRSRACLLTVLSCLLVGCLSSPVPVDHATGADSKEARRLRRAGEDKIAILDLRGVSARDSLDRLRSEIDLRAQRARRDGFSPDETAYALEPLLQRYFQSIRKVASGASKTDLASFLDSEAIQWKGIRSPSLADLDATGVSPLLARIDAFFDEQLLQTGVVPQP